MSRPGLRRRWARPGAALVAARFTWAAIAAQTMRLIRGVETIVELIRWALGLLTLPILIWLPGAVCCGRCSAPPGRVRTDGPAWTFLAVAISVLLTGVLGFTLAEIGWFSAWLIALLEAGRLPGARCASMAGDWAAVLPRRRARWLRDLGDTLWTGAAHRRAGASCACARTPATCDWRTSILAGLLLVGGGAVRAPRRDDPRRARLRRLHQRRAWRWGAPARIVQHDQLMRELLDIDPPPAYPRSKKAKSSCSRRTPTATRSTACACPASTCSTSRRPWCCRSSTISTPSGSPPATSCSGCTARCMTTPLLALLACAAVFFFARQMFSARVALVGLAFLITCPLQIWFARYPVSETADRTAGLRVLLAFCASTEETRRLSTLRD